LARPPLHAAREAPGTAAWAALERSPAPSQLIVLAYHRIAARASEAYCNDVVTAPASRLDEQVRALKRRHAIVGEDEALAIIGGRHTRRGTALLLTFDDGYLDNLTVAAPVLSAHGVRGLFFLVTGFLDDPWQVPWWDRIAWLVRHCRGRTLVLEPPTGLSLSIDEGSCEAVTRRLIRLHRYLAPADAAAMLEALERCAGASLPASRNRLLMGWDEARRLRALGHDIGAHTCTHPALSMLAIGAQRAELSEPLRAMELRLGVRPRTLAYPYGVAEAIGPDAARLAREAGYEAAFSFYGGSNVVGRTDRYDVRRIELPLDAGALTTRATIATLAAARGLLSPRRGPGRGSALS
jgi:peptidoglycan/xylan/chitin deacetylase (PgdA/CDA1 family)